MSILSPPRPSLPPVSPGAGGNSVPPVGPPPGGEPPSLPPSAPRRPTWTILRIVLGSLLVLLAAAGGTAVFILEQVHTLVQDLSVNKALKIDRGVLAASYYGGPETLLMVGDDTRSVYKHYNGIVPNLANEMLLVRIDPNKPYISMMSIPRELWVTFNIPGGGTFTNRLNSAYTYGATTLVQAIKQITGLSVNHVIATTFTQFEKAINELGCVYDTIDERYYHNNADGGEQYQNVNLQPGYQCLTGGEAEQFVSYRHTDTSQVRDARDQSFLLAVKKQYGPELSGNIGKFERIFGKTVETDAGLRSNTEVLNLANLLITAAGLRVRQVPFAAEPSYSVPAGDLTATPEQIQQSVHNFLFGGGGAPSRQTAATAKKVKHRGGLAHLPLTPTLSATVTAEKQAAGGIPFTAEFPKVQDSNGAGLIVAPRCTEVMEPCLRNYLVHAPGGAAYPIYVEVFSNGQLGQFYDVQGTTWTTAPLFSNPDQTVRVGNRVYDLFYDGSLLQTVAWHENGAVYWVHNTLTNSIGAGELLAIAEQTAPIAGSRAIAKHALLSLKAAHVPIRLTVASTTSLKQTIGGLAGLVTLVCIPLLGIFAIVRMTRLRRPRTALATGRQIGERLPVPFGSYSRREPGPGGMPLYATPSASAGIAAPPRGMSVPYAPPRYRPVTKVYKRSWWRTPLLVLGMLLVIAAAAVSVVVIVRSGHSPSAATLRREALAARARRVPNVPVIVLNATSVTGAAHRLALTLGADGVKVSSTGNLVEGVPAPGLQILYGKGERAQADKLARLLRKRSPTVAPIDPNTAAAVGNNPKLVVVIT